MTSLIRYLTIFLVLASVLIGMHLVSGYVQAQTPATPGIDMFVLVDQSGSMGGFNNREPTDPDDLRVDTAQYLVDYLGFDAIIHSDNINRVSVIGFGSPDETHVMAPLASVSSATVQESDQIRQEIKGKIVPEKLGNTSVVSALEIVNQELAYAQDLGNNRQVIIVVITDGMPYDSRELGQNKYFDEIEEEYAALQSQYKNQWALFVVGIDAQDTYWPFVEPQWQRLAKMVSRVEQSEAMKTEIVRMLSPELGYEGNVFGPGNIFVEPYLDTISFSVFKYSNDGSITISYPDSNGDLVELKPDDPQVLSTQVGQRYEIWVVKNPVSGTWRIELQEEGQVDVFKQIQFTSIQMEYPTSGHARYFPFHFRFTLPQGQKLEPKYPLDLQVTLFEPGGDGTGIVLPCCTQADDDVLSAPKPYVPQRLGGHKVHIHATTTFDNDGKRQEITIWEGEYSFLTYDVTASIAFPSPPYVQYLPISQVKFNLTNPQGNLITEDPVLLPDLSLEVVVPSGQITTIPLKRVASGQYSTTKALTLPGDGPKGLDLVIRDEQGDELFRYMLQVDTFRDVKLTYPLSLIPLNGSLSSLAVQLLDQNGQAVGPSSDYPLELQAIIFALEGNPVTSVLTYDPAKGVFSTTEPTPIPTGVEGDYRIHIVGKSKIDGGEVATFEDDLSYSVTSNLPYYRAVSPSSAELSYPLHDGLSRADMPIQIQWIQNGEPIDPATVFQTKPADLVTVDITGPGDIAISDLRLKQVSEKTPSIWGISVPQLRNEGLYTATFHFQEARLLSQEPYMNFDDAVVSFARTETLLWRTLRFGAGTVLSVMIAFALVRLSIEIYERAVPPFPRGTVSILEYEPGVGIGVSVARLNLLKRRRRTVTWRLGTEKMKALGLYKMIVRRRLGRPIGQRRQEGIDLEVFDKDGKRLFGMTFDRGAGEKRIPRRSLTRSAYRIKYEPPL